METLNISDQSQIVEYKLEKAMSYEAYRSFLDELAERQLTTGKDQTETYVNYTLLNARRFKRWDKTLKIDQGTRDILRDKNLPGMTWIILTESWCGDAAHIMPVMNKLAEEIGNIDIKILMRDENLSLMDNYLTDGARSIPKLIAVDKESKEELFVYGPRPSTATLMVSEYKANHGSLTAEFKEDLQRWYNKDKGQTAINDLVEKLLAL